MRVTVQVDKRTGQVLQGVVDRLAEFAAVPEARDLLDCVRSLGGSLQAVHPGTSDPELVRFFEVDVPDPTVAEVALATLQACRGVGAAYAKPPDAPPS